MQKKQKYTMLLQLRLSVQTEPKLVFNQHKGKEVISVGLALDEGEEGHSGDADDHDPAPHHLDGQL